MKRFIIYLIRWQLSTPILWLVVRQLGAGLGATVIANLIGGAIFFWVDRFIFTSPAFEVWHVKDRGVCDKCGKEDSLRRLVKTRDYDRSTSAAVFLCPACSREKLDELKGRGIRSSHSA
jgi:hypothetical protein